MANLFINIYNFFSHNKAFMWLLLGVTVILMIVSAVNVRYVEDITNFFPKQKQDISLIFDNLKAKDKLVVMFTLKSDESNIDSLIACAEDLSELVNANKEFTEQAKIKIEIDDSMVESMSDFVYDYLPLFLDDADFEQLDSITQSAAIAERINHNYNNLLSPIGGYISDFVYKDPLGLGSNLLKELKNQGNNFHYTIVDNYIFSTDQKTLLCYVEPITKLNSSQSDRFIETLESSIETIQQKHPHVITEYFGAPAVAVYNARQIKTDSMVTLNIAMLIVVLFITLAFRNKYSILLVLTPVIYGALFALSLIYIIQGEISLIAVGSGSIIFGIALSYSIHILSHTNHCRDVKQLLEELVFPLTVGSFTTIGAFVGLMFTNSTLLYDFGLFSSLTLIGTTLFALIFLPHFLTVKPDKEPSNRLLTYIDKISNLRLDRNKPLVISIIVVALISGLFFSNVSFDSNMMNLNFNPPHLQEAEIRLNSFAGVDDKESNVLFIASANNGDDATKEYNELCTLLASLQANGEVSAYSTVNKFIISDSVQSVRLAKWRKFWTSEKQSQIISEINREASKLGFDAGAFAQFDTMLAKRYNKLSYGKKSPIQKLFPDWCSSGESITSFIAQVRLHKDNKAKVYETISSTNGVIAADRAFFAGKMVEDVNYNFYLILYISGFLIFFALLLSYGRIELTLMSFLPMFVSWLIILGIISLLNIEFNIVTIILSTFIFGIGDDFSIFIMDGLLSEYKEKSHLLTQHKTAIFFSAFTVIVGMGALVFAKHPAMYSLGVVSLIGILVVVLVSYTIQPFIFRLFISSQTTKGGFPYTLFGLINTIYAFGLFVSGCFIVQFIILLLHLIPISIRSRKDCTHYITNYFTRFFLRAMITTKVININETAEIFAKPAVIIANHQSFIDILKLLALHPKFVMVTNGWVWHSPFFGRIVRFLDFYHTGEGYEVLADSLSKKVEQGYSVIIFPEGTRSADNKIKRFHKGAFYLAERLKLDIVPILIYGNGLVSSKQQPFYIKKGKLITKVLPRIPHDSSEYGTDYKTRSKNISHYFKAEYNKVYEVFNRVSNPYYKDALIKNYIYKGPVLEWYMKVKLRMEKWYDEYDRLLPRQGYIVDLGCGYGAMSYMLSMLSDKRQITSVDYDDKKIALANNCYAKNEMIEFIHADIRRFDIPKADAYVISDVLHYIDKQSQQTVINNCIANLNKGGILIIRDGDTSLHERHHRTEQTEKWSTEILKFNKTDGPLCFLSKGELEEIAKNSAMNIQVRESNSQNSNTLFILTHKKE